MKRNHGNAADSATIAAPIFLLTPSLKPFIERIQLLKPNLLMKISNKCICLPVYLIWAWAWTELWLSIIQRKLLSKNKCPAPLRFRLRLGFNRPATKEIKRHQRWLFICKGSKGNCLELALDGLGYSWLAKQKLCNK